MYNNLQIPQMSTAGLFAPPNYMATMDAAYQGLDRGMKTREAFRQAEVRKKLRELVRKHDITTPQGKLALVKELSDNGLAEEVMRMDRDFKSQAGQVLDTPDGYQVADPAYGRAHPMQGGGLLGRGQDSGTEPPGWAAPAPQPGGSNQSPQRRGLLGGPGQGMPSHRSQERIEESELRLGFDVWMDKIAKPFAEARGNKYSRSDINNLRSTLPKELRGYSGVEDYLQGLQVEPEGRAGRGSSAYNAGGLARNIEEIDAELDQAEQDLQDLESNKPARASREWSENTFRLRTQVRKLREERRRYQARGPAKGGSPGAGSRGKLPAAEARKYLERVGGDKDKARELAKREGWTF